MGDADALTSLLRRDRAVAAAALAGVVLIAWVYLFFGMGMEVPEVGAMLAPAMTEHWSRGYAAMMLLMWVIMMAAMMLPSAAPMILLHATLARRRRELGGVAPATGVFVLGYVAIWALFSALATALQWALSEAAQMSSAMSLTSRLAAASILIAAGVYQWTPLKQSCLRHCRTPLDFVLGHWREGTWGGFAMGVRHGGFCLGCCWVLMLLLFVGGVMNTLWIAGLTLFVLVEKTAPWGHWGSQVAGGVLVLWGFSALLSMT